MMLHRTRLYKIGTFAILFILSCSGCNIIPSNSLTQSIPLINEENEVISQQISPYITESVVVIPTITSTPVPTNTPVPTPVIIVTATPTPTCTPTPTPILDVLAPIIEGAEDKVVFVGETVSYKKGIVISDDIDESPTFTVDSSEVDLNTPGVYPVTYIATDSSGNTTSLQITVTVTAIDDKASKVKRMATEVISTTITENMSKWDACYSLWNWCRRNIKYTNTTGDRTSIYTGAYEGFFDHKGDCYTFYATFAVLLTECGIDNLEVRRIGGTSNHWWNLVNVGDGWYHCDSSPRKAGHTYLCFMQTDAQIQEYTEYYTAKPNYYVFDDTNLPERGTVIVFDGNLNQ